VIGEGVVGGSSEKCVLERKRKSLEEGKGQLKKKRDYFFISKSVASFYEWGNCTKTEMDVNALLSGLWTPGM
jgi:hypothetical protein